MVCKFHFFSFDFILSSSSVLSLQWQYKQIVFHILYVQIAVRRPFFHHQFFLCALSIAKRNFVYLVLFSSSFRIKWWHSCNFFLDFIFSLFFCRKNFMTATKEYLMQQKHISFARFQTMGQRKNYFIFLSFWLLQSHATQTTKQNKRSIFSVYGLCVFDCAGLIFHLANNEPFLVCLFLYAQCRKMVT